MKPTVDQLVEQYSNPEMLASVDLKFILDTIIWLQPVTGAIIEMGCHDGSTSVAIEALLQATGSRKQFHVCDSFQGLPEPERCDGTNPSKGDLIASKQNLLTRFKNHKLEPPIIHEGWFHQIKDYPLTLSFAYLDGDLYRSIYDSLAFTWWRMSKGGIVLIHDYNNSNLPGVRQACLDFFGEELSLINGLAIKEKA